MKNGPYILIIPPDDYPGKRYRGRYAYEHRVVFWKENGYLPELVHHINEDKQDNDGENLEGIDNSTHTASHNKARITHSYRNGCRCDECKMKSRDAQRRWRANKRAAVAQ